MKRIEWIDSLKGFGIFCVTFGHLACHYLIETHIYSFHMFLFFFISGFLHKKTQGSFKKHIARKTKSLLIPFLLWNVISCFAGLFLGTTLSETIRLFFLLDGVICWNAPIWFLIQLYIVEIVFFLVERHIPYGRYFSIPILMALWVFVSGNNIFLKLNILPVSLLFYVFGNISSYFINKYSTKDRRTPKFVIPAALLLLCINIVFGVYLNQRISFTGANFGNVMYCCLGAVSGVLFYLIVFRNSRFLGTNKVLSYLGKNSLIIMAVQYWFFMLFDRISNRFFNLSVWYYRNTLKALAVAVVTILLICLMVELLKKIGVRSPVLKKICIWFGINVS